MQTVKVMVVGDHEAEKTSLLFSFASKSPSVPMVFETYCTTLTIRGEPVDVSLWDTAGQDDYDRLRPLSYPQTDVFLICFSVVSPSSYEKARKKWVPEITRHCPDVPFLLVGTRTDLRSDRGVLDKQRPLWPEDGETLAQELRAVKYMECSVETKEGVEEVLEEAVLAALEEDEEAKKKKKCILQ